MIFVTVGTHEQPFDRLIRKLDDLICEGKVTEEVFMQVGYCKYRSRHCKWAKLLPFELMEEKISEAKIVITHGGPGSIMPVLSHGKIPIVVPRQKRFKEHIDDHQVFFVKKLSEKARVIAVYDIDDLQNAIENYDERITKLRRTFDKDSVQRKAADFARKIEEICVKLLKEGKR